MDDEIRHFCDAVLLNRACGKKLEEIGICTVQDLMAIKEKIERGELFRDMKSVPNGFKAMARDALLAIIEWREMNPDTNIKDDFNDEVYDKFILDRDFVETYIDALGQPYREHSLFKDVEADKTLLTAIIKKCKEKVMKSNHLRNACGKFDYDSFIDKAVRHFHGLVNHEPGAHFELVKLFIVAGRTQAGKTAVKAVMQSMCGLLRIPLVILTKGVGESIGLHAKLVAFSDGILVKKEHIVVGESFGIITSSLHFVTAHLCTSASPLSNFQQHRTNPTAVGPR